uniref:Uncharacterized protein n=1 Tax=Cucumis melo TaxID=3656 RepID=A0A9I9D454_CUCME
MAVCKQIRTACTYGLRGKGCTQLGKTKGRAMNAMVRALRIETDLASRTSLNDVSTNPRYNGLAVDDATERRIAADAWLKIEMTGSGSR